MILMGLACSQQILSDVEKEEAWEFTEESNQTIQMAEGLHQPMGLMAYTDESWVVAEYGTGSLLLIDNMNTITPLVENLDGPHSLWKDELGIIAATDSSIWIESNGEFFLAATDLSSPSHPRRLENTLYWFEEGALWSQTEDNQPLLIDDDVNEPAGIAIVSNSLYFADGNSQELRIFQPGTTQIEIVFEFNDPPKDIHAYVNNSILATTQSTRWPYGGWIVTIENGNETQMSDSPPEPNQIKSFGEDIAWSSKQSLTALRSNEETYGKIAGPNAIGDFHFHGDGFIWTDSQSGKLYQSTD